ncbi:MAG: L,D-transpeptidase family protein [Lachnospiraceae bacterium]
MRPPWGTALGGEIYLHEGGTASDWTQGCIALESADMARLFERWQDIETVTILP